MTGADMTDGDFHRNSFVKAKLAGANLTGAIVPRSVFHEADLAGASFSGAILYRSRFEGTDLSAVKDLTQAQLDTVCGDSVTKLPAGLVAPTHWPCGED